MARTVAVTSLIVALCVAAAVAGHSRYGAGAHRPVVGVHGSVHRPVSVHGSVHTTGGLHGSVHRPVGLHGSAHTPVGLHGSVHRPVGVHGNVGVHGGSVHGHGVVGSGIHGAGSFNTAHYPNIVPGYSFYDNRPTAGYNKCKFWCKSDFTGKYYCCQRPYQG